MSFSPGRQLDLQGFFSLSFYFSFKTSAFLDFHLSHDFLGAVESSPRWVVLSEPREVRAGFRVIFREDFNVYPSVLSLQRRLSCIYRATGTQIQSRVKLSPVIGHDLGK
jgi:hypothetical protein